MNLFLKKHWWLLSLIVILFFAAFIRFYKLGLVPHGMTWDEAAIGYNGYAIFNTRRDEWLQRLPVSFQSFGDYKAPLAIYINGFFTYLFGMSLFAVRLPFVISSLMAILGFVLVVAEVFKKNKHSDYYSLFAGLLIATSPWYFHYSRAGFESGMALSFLIWGLFFLIKTLETNFKKIWLSIAAVISFSAAIYTYHSSKVVIPLLLILFFIIFYKIIIKNFKRLIFPGVIFVGLLFPFIKDSFLGEGLARAGVTIFSSQLSVLEKLSYILSSYASHFSPKFLLLGETTTLRHGTGYLGVLFLTTFLLATLGLFSFAIKKGSKYKALFLGLLIIGLLPACISMEIPHSNRSLLALPGFILLATYGLDWLIIKISKSAINQRVLGSHGEKNIILKSIVGSILMIHFLIFISFLSHYFSVFSKESASSFKDGYLEAFEIAQKYEKGNGVEEVDKIIFTSDYGQPYIYALFVRKTNPIWYRGGSLVKYEFYENIDINDLSRNNALVVGSEDDDLPIDKADHVVYGSDGKMRFQIYRTEKY